MKFFTPELYQRFNSADDKEADRANEDWEKVLHDYEKHLEAIRPDMPPRVKELADTHCFHDAELLALKEAESEPIFLRSFPFWPFLPIAILSLKREEQLAILVYLLWHRIRQSPPSREWPFSTLKRHWLYDEIDADHRDPGFYWHRILLSDGTEIEIPFFDVMVQTIPLASHAAQNPTRKGA